jgi:hypothetical protein
LVSTAFHDTCSAWLRLPACKDDSDNGTGKEADDQAPHVSTKRQKEEHILTRFLVTYRGSGIPSDPAQIAQAQAAFGEWLARAGEAVVDPGAPLRPGTQVSNGAATPQVMIGGYSVIEAANLEEAADVLKSHPFVARGGTLQVDEAMG